MSNLLINEPPLQVLPTLAAEIGLNEAIVLQQIHYWISNPKVGKEHDGQRWIYNSVREWQDTNFPFWSEATIKRALHNLREMGLVLAENLNASTYDRTLWYTIDYRHLVKLESSIWSNCTNGVGQDDQIESSNLTQPIPENTQRISKDHDHKSNGDGGGDFASAVNAYEQNIGMLTPIISELIQEAVDEHPEGWVEKAIGIAAEANKRNWRYINGILKNWRTKGFEDTRSNGRGAHVEYADDEAGGFYV